MNERSFSLRYGAPVDSRITLLAELVKELAPAGLRPSRVTFDAKGISSVDLLPLVALDADDEDKPTPAERAAAQRDEMMRRYRGAAGGIRYDGELIR